MDQNAGNQKRTETTPVVAPSSAGTKQKQPAPNQLISFGERFTYTFAVGDEVGAVHFDAAKKEIFIKGHNVHNIDLEDWQMKILDTLRGILSADPQSSKFAEPYSRTLDKILAHKKTP